MNNPRSQFQLQWESKIVEYVQLLWEKTRTQSKRGEPSKLGVNIPLLGPQFMPPSYLHIQKRSGELHGMFCEEMALGAQLHCNRCKEMSKSMPKARNGTTHSSGLDSSIEGYCFTMTSTIYWKSWEHWRIPCESCVHGRSNRDLTYLGLGRGHTNLFLPVCIDAGLVRSARQVVAIFDICRS
ncbi:uncharacterized protein EDB93DRAFT_1092063 [Suillus bovinus]|uniref:uncharacterized protein n=1 Tax=Suillus bovinus TaxID=48563 RepID=UPI001B865611|nr:uncharacterized protein EDB93DRAFT_1092063 [Suillus bovinus]KAG2135867.1 hypothetical protein EDB93DRAFT_1092063 [Suillus bovinus]